MIQFSDSTVDKNFTLISTAAVLAAIVAGFWLLGSPGKQRLISLDSQRVQDLSSIASQMNSDLTPINEAAPAKPLPEQLPERISDQFKDPETQVPYSYRRINDNAYELCATFALASDEKNVNTQVIQPLGDVRWKHPAGLHCYEFDKLGFQPK
jgi:hypothetical protein